MRYALIAVAALLAAAPLLAQEDDQAPTIVEWRASGAPWGPYTEWKQATIHPTENAQEGTPIADAPGSFRWIRYRSGPQACFYTATMHEDGTLTDIGGGRDCAHPGSSCGYYMEGWTIFGASGQDCTAIGVPQCEGICW